MVYKKFIQPQPQYIDGMRVTLESVRSWGLKILSENLYLVRFKTYRDGGYFKIKTSKLFGLEAGIPRSCKTIVYFRGSSYEGTLICDHAVRMHIPSFLTNFIQDEVWLYVKKIDDRIVFFDSFEKKIDDYILEFNPFSNICGSRSPRYSKGYKYCSKCREGYLIDVRNCPRCGTPLRAKPRGRKKNGLESLCSGDVMK